MDEELKLKNLQLYQQALLDNQSNSNELIIVPLYKEDGTMGFKLMPNKKEAMELGANDPLFLALTAGTSAGKLALKGAYNLGVKGFTKLQPYLNIMSPGTKEFMTMLNSGIPGKIASGAVTAAEGYWINEAIKQAKENPNIGNIAMAGLSMLPYTNGAAQAVTNGWFNLAKNSKPLLNLTFSAVGAWDDLMDNINKIGLNIKRAGVKFDKWWNADKPVNKLTSHLQGNDAVKMFKEYSSGYTLPATETENIRQLRAYIPEVRERYGLVGNTNVSDDDILKALYKQVLELDGGTAARNIDGEPLLLFRGDTKSYTELKPRVSPEKLVIMGGASLLSKAKTIPNFITKTIRNGNQPLKNSIAIGGLKLTNTFESLTPSKGNKIIAKRLDDLYYRDRLIDEHLNFGENSNILVHGDPAATGVYTTSSGIGKGVATVENYPYFKNGKLYPTKDRYTDYKGDVQNLIFWGDGMPFFETRGKEFENILNLLNKPSDYKYFSNVNKERLISNALDFPTENPYRFIISEKPKNSTIRNSIGVSRAGKEIITNDIPMDVLQGFEYDPLTKTFNRVLYHTPTLGYKKYIPNNSEKTYLRLLEKPSKLTEAEKLGIPKGERSSYLIGSNADPSYYSALGLNNNKYIQSLRDFHFKQTVPDNVFNDLTFVHSTNTNFNVFDKKFFGSTDDGYHGKGFYFSTVRPASKLAKLSGVILGPHGEMPIMNYGKNKMYVYLKGVPSEAKTSTYNYFDQPDELGVALTKGTISKPIVAEIITGNPSNIKSANAITYDDFGNIIPLSKRDNFNISDIRYKQGGSIHIKEKNKGKFTESAKRAGKSVQEHARDVVNHD